MNVVRELDEAVWREFVDRHSHGNVFHTPEMFQAFVQTKDHHPTLWAIVDNDQVLALLLPVQITLMGRLFQSFTTRAVAYGSLLCQSGPKGEAALALLLETYKRQVQRNTLFTELRNLSDLSSLQTVLDDNNFHCEPHLNYLIDLNRSSEEVLQSIGRRTRKIIRRGLRKKTAKVSEVSNKHELAIWYSTIQKTYKKAHVPLASQDLFENTFDQLHHKGMAKFLVAKIDGEIAACSVELLYKDVIYGWYGGSDKGYSRYFPNEMLIWHILEWGSNNGFRVYDFGGAGKPDEEYGVRDFKAKFHGNLVNFGRNICIHSSRRFALSEFMYRIYRRFL